MRIRLRRREVLRALLVVLMIGMGLGDAAGPIVRGYVATAAAWWSAPPPPPAIAVVLSSSGWISFSTAQVTTDVPRWQICLKGVSTTATITTCARCGREIRWDGRYSDSIYFRDDDGRVFFDGCMRCLEDSVGAVGS